MGDGQHPLAVFMAGDIVAEGAMLNLDEWEKQWVAWPSQCRCFECFRGWEEKVLVARWIAYCEMVPHRRPFPKGDTLSEWIGRHAGGRRYQSTTQGCRVNPCWL